MAEYLGAVELGGLYKDGVIQPRPTKPWRINSEPFNGIGIGDIAPFSALPDMNKWNISDTPTDSKNKLKWIKIKDGNKTLLICDRCILTDITWQHLDSAGYVNGKEIIIDGEKYLCRLLIGGNNYRSGTDGHSGGSPIDNEWDRFVCNEDKMKGLPIPTSGDLDGSLDSTDLDGEHNQLWHWWGIWSWCQEVSKTNSAYRVMRGYESASYFNDYPAGARAGYVGWKPILEKISTQKYLIQQSENYYSINNHYINITKENNNLEKLIKEYGHNDIPILTKELNNKKIPTKVNKDYYESFDIELNDVKDNVCLIEEDDKKYIQYDCDTYRILDKIKENNNGKFDIVMKEF